MQAALIILMSVVAAVIYGVVHDLITAHLCVEYFTIGHPRIIASTSPIALALAWGVVATWWVGLPLGAVLAAACRAGIRPPRDARSLVTPLAVLLAAMLVTAAIAGVIVHAIVGPGLLEFVSPVAHQVPGDRHRLFLACWAMHIASYASGGLGGLGLALWVYTRRGRARTDR